MSSGGVKKKNHENSLVLKFPNMLRKSTESKKCQCCPHIETSQLICKAYQVIDFYMRATLAFNGLRIQESII